MDEANLLKILHNNISNGNTWVSEAYLREYLTTLSPLKTLIEKGKLLFHKALTSDDVNCFTFPIYHIAENEIASNVVRIASEECKTYDKAHIDALIKRAEKELNITLHEEQYNAVCMAIEYNFIILTGGPGTGKTCVLQVIYRVLKYINENSNILFLAPTGKAARRITESTGQTAFTTNKKLQVWEGHMEPTMLENVDAVICDEFSMSDTLVSAALFKAIPTGCKTILVGDIDQLPSVGAGDVLHDLIDSGVVPVIRLTKTFRQAGDSYILLNSLKIRSGNARLETNEHFNMQKTKNFKESADYMISEYMRYVEKYGVENVVCLTPYKTKGEASANELNKRIQSLINPYSHNKNEVSYYDTIFREGDIVMQLKNKQKCVNGEVGKIKTIDTDGTIYVEYIDSYVHYDKTQYKELSLAYAMTVHKSQGSEYLAIVTCFNKGHGRMLLRNLVYTAITRAKYEVSIGYEQEALDAAITNESVGSRLTLLVAKLEYENKKARFFKSNKKHII